MFAQINGADEINFSLKSFGELFSGHADAFWPVFVTGRFVISPQSLGGRRSHETLSSRVSCSSAPATN